MAMPVICRCEKCGREFVTLPKTWPATDSYPPADVHYRAKDLPTNDVCGGQLVANNPPPTGLDGHAAGERE